MQLGLKTYFLRIPWGTKSITALYLSLLSGALLALQYNPAEPFYSTNSIDILVPFGAFMRSVHFYASQLFFLLSACHLVAIIWDGQQARLKFSHWLKLIGALMLTVLLLFTGYVLRGDMTGSSAGAIAENIALSIPVAGKLVNGLLFSISTDGMTRVYANHVICLGLIWLFLSWNHLRRYVVSPWQNSGLSVSVILFCALIPAPMEPARLGTYHITGPWFFLGVQEALKYIPVFWAGVVFPLTFLILLLFLHQRQTFVKKLGLALIGWLLIYALLSGMILTG